MKRILDFLAPVKSRSATSRFSIKSDAKRRLRTYAKSSKRPRSWLQSLVPCCRRVQRTLQFVVKGARGNYPVQLQQVRSLSRNRKHVFHNAAGIQFTMKGFRVPLRFVVMFSKRRQKKSPQECAERPSRGHLISFSAEESQASCRADGVYDVQKRYSGGILAAVRPCGVVPGFMDLMSPESPTHAYLFLAELLDLAASKAEYAFDSRPPVAHAEFVSSHIALLWYDCACTFLRFVNKPERMSMSPLAGAMAHIPMSIDKWHYRKGHKGCKPGGRRPVPEVDPAKHAHKFPCLNDSACEQSFGFIRAYVSSARYMAPLTMTVFLHLLFDLRNQDIAKSQAARKAIKAERKRSERKDVEAKRRRMDRGEVFAR